MSCRTPQKCGSFLVIANQDNVEAAEKEPVLDQQICANFTNHKVYVGTLHRSTARHIQWPPKSDRPSRKRDSYRAVADENEGATDEKPVLEPQVSAQLYTSIVL